MTTGRPLRITHVIETLGPGGAERLLYTNLKHLAALGFQSTVVTVFSDGDYWAEPIRRLGVQVTTLGCRGYSDLLAGGTRLHALLRREPTDLLHTHLWAANIVGRVAGRLARVPVISSIHNPDHEPEAWADGSEVGRHKRWLGLSLDRWTAWFGCTRMVVVSKYVGESTARRLRFPAARTELLYNPIDVNEFQPTEGRARAELLRELGLPADCVLLLNVGRVSPQKGLLYAIRALPSIRRRYPAAQLLSVGPTADTHWHARLKAEAQSLGVAEHVHIAGPRRDVPDLLRACDLFVFPSLYEGLGIALIEAMAMGCACVATNVGPIPELIQPGRDGWLIPPHDAEALAEAVCTLLADPERRAALGRAASNSALTRFQPQRAAERLAEIYRSVIRR
jgi:glycosyltransferase involved in cell wall biosynthesis